MEKVDVCYATNKNGVYVQFKLTVHARELSELNAYDEFMRKSIEKDFKVLFDLYGMDFSTDSAYVIRMEDKNHLVSCLNGDWSPELEETLGNLGVEKRDIQW